jgi:hypothetical protein
LSWYADDDVDYDYEGWKTKPDSYDYNLSGYMEGKENYNELWLSWQPSTYGDSDDEISVRFTNPEIIQKFVEVVEDISTSELIERTLPQFDTTEEYEKEMGEYPENIPLWEFELNSTDNEELSMGLSSWYVEGVVKLHGTESGNQEDGYTTQSGYTQSETDIGEVVHQFILDNVKELTMDDVISMFGNEELVWYDFEPYNISNHDTIDLGNSWTLQVNDYKEAGEEYVYDGSKKPDSIILSNGSVSMDIRKDTIQAFWDLHGN